jgi:hypothetical protein
MTLMRTPGPEELTRIEAELRDRVQTARRRYEGAKAEASRLNDIRIELGLNHSDGSLAALHAARIERVALQEYSAQLQVFSDLILRHKLPET